MEEVRMVQFILRLVELPSLPFTKSYRSAFMTDIGMRVAQFPNRCTSFDFQDQAHHEGTHPHTNKVNRRRNDTSKIHTRNVSRTKLLNTQHDTRKRCLERPNTTWQTERIAFSSTDQPPRHVTNQEVARMCEKGLPSHMFEQVIKPDTSNDGKRGRKTS